MNIQRDVPSIFLCYAREDFERVHALYTLLKGLGLRPWFDKYDIAGGERWQDEIEKAVKNADFFIASFSKASIMKRGFVQREYKLAMNALAERPRGDVFLIPVRLDDCNLPDLRGLGTKLSDFHWVDLFQTGKLSVQDIAPILRSIEAHSNWRRLQPQPLLGDLRREHETPDRFIIKIGGRVVFLRVEEIDWMRTVGNYVRLQVGRDSHLMRETMSAMEAKLSPDKFMRIHRSTIVNLDRVKEVQPWEKGEYIVFMRDGTRLIMSRHYWKRLNERLNKHT